MKIWFAVFVITLNSMSAFAGTYRVFGGVDNQGSVLSNIAPGTNLTDAVNVSQLAAFGVVGGNTHDWWFTPKVTGIGRNALTTGGPIVFTNYEDIITYDYEIRPLTYTTSYDVVVGDMPEEVRFYSYDGNFVVNPTNGYCVSQVDGVWEISMVSDSLTRTLSLTSATTLPGDLGMIEQLASHIYLANTVKQHVNTNMLALIQGQDGTDSNLFLYSVQDHAATNYVRNTNCWAYSLDLTCASPWNSTGDGSLAGQTGLPSGQFRPATAITRRHILSSDHYHLRQSWSGSDTNFLVRFVDQNNNVYERTATAHQQVLGADWSITNKLTAAQNDPAQYGYIVPTNRLPDYVVLRLDTELPAAIVPAKRLPPDWLDYMPYTQGFSNEINQSRWNENFPLVMTDQQERATIGESLFMGLGSAASYDPDFGTYGQGFYFNPASTLGRTLFERRDTYIPFYRDKINGDSSSPILLFINGDPVLTGTLTTGFGGGAWMDAVWCYDRIQDVITNDFGDTNIWETVDLSGFITFPGVE